MDYFSCVSARDLGYSSPIFPNCPNTRETGIAEPAEGSDTRVRSHLMWNKDLKTWILFICPCRWVGVFGPNFPKLPQYPSTCETGIVQPTEGPDTRVSSHLMWNKELKTLDFFFMCLCTWFGVFGPNFPKLPQYLSTCETGVIRSTEGLDTSIRSHLMWNKELKTLDFFLCDSLLDLGVFRPFSPKLC